MISIFCDRLRRGAQIDIFGDGGQTRDFIYVADVVTALRAAMARCGPGAPAIPDAPTVPDRPIPAASVFNVCTGVAISVSELAQTVAA